MQTTAPGQNRTGAAVAPKQVDLMLDAVRALSPPIPISTLQMDVERQGYITESDSVGSIPPAKSTTKTASKAKATKGKGVMPSLFLDKLGERIAFERTGTRLYDALITKYLALSGAEDDVLPPAAMILNAGSAPSGREPLMDETPVDTLRRIRAEELAHFRMLCDLVVKMGGDPTAQTPCADVTAAASMGLMQVITDPRTTLAQCLNTILSAELTDNAGWELLSELAEEVGQREMLKQFSEALSAEQQHLAIVRGWLKELLMNEAGTPAV